MTLDDPSGPPADILASGREPSPGQFRAGRLVRLLLIAQTMALAALAVFALHDRPEATRGNSSLPPRVERPAQEPLSEIASTILRLPARGGLSGTVVITAAAVPGAARGQVVVSALIAGGEPRTVYDLIGNDCSTLTPLPSHVLATGLTDTAGAARLTGHPWTGPRADRYWLALTPSPARRPPGLRGRFGHGEATPFPAGQRPCAASR